MILLSAKGNIIGIIGLLLLIFGIPIIGYILGSIQEKAEEKGKDGKCSCIIIILMIVITIGSAIGMMKSCAKNDRGPSIDYYDAPRK